MINEITAKAGTFIVTYKAYLIGAAIGAALAFVLLKLKKGVGSNGK